MNTFFVYVFMGLVVSINVELLGQGLTGSKGGFDAIMKALNGNNVQELKELLDIGFAGFLVLVACCLFAFKLTGQASDLAGTMAGGKSVPTSAVWLMVLRQKAFREPLRQVSARLKPSVTKPGLPMLSTKAEIGRKIKFGVLSA